MTQSIVWILVTIFTQIVLATNREHTSNVLYRNHEIINTNNHSIQVFTGQKGEIEFIINPPVRERLETHLILESSEDNIVTILGLEKINENVYNFPLNPDIHSNGTFQRKIISFETSMTNYGKVVIYLIPINYSIYDQIDSTQAFAWISVAKSYLLIDLYQILRFVNLIFWSLCLYPQLILNHQRRSTRGLTYDYVLLTWICSLTGLIKLWMYNIDKVQKQSLIQKPRDALGGDTVDWIFVSHDFIFALVLISQTVLYRDDTWKGSSEFTKKFVDFFFYAGSYSIFAALVGYADWILFLNLVTDFHFGSRVLRSIIQAFRHHKVKSTHGFSVYVPICEMIGSIVLPFQLLVSLFNYNTFNYEAAIFVAMLIFKVNITLVSQHFCLYGSSVALTPDELTPDFADNENNLRPMSHTIPSNSTVRGRETIGARINKIIANRRMPLINEVTE